MLRQLATPAVARCVNIAEVMFASSCVVPRLVAAVEGCFTWGRLVFVAGMLAVSCGDDSPSEANLDSDGEEPTLPRPPSHASEECRNPAQGCACENEGEVIECGEVKRTSGDYVACSMGTRECNGGVWTACNGDRVAALPEEPTSLRRLASTPTSTTCDDNPCDPYCRVFDDSPEDVDIEPGSNVEVGDDGLQLVPVPPSNSGSVACTSIEVVPSPQTFTVTPAPDLR